jgi:DNA-binding winged helix-turn-helix (wHTH) protein
MIRKETDREMATRHPIAIDAIGVSQTSLVRLLEMAGLPISGLISADAVDRAPVPGETRLLVLLDTDSMERYLPRLQPLCVEHRCDLVVFGERMAMDERAISACERAVFVAELSAGGEMPARLRSAVRRIAPNLLEDVISGSDVVLDIRTHETSCAGKDIRVGPTGRRLLELLLTDPGRVHSREDLASKIGRLGHATPIRNVDIQIRLIRRACESVNCGNPIVTHYGEGYSIPPNDK